MRNQPEDLTVLCGGCHKLFHRRAEQQVQEVTLEAALHQTITTLDSQLGSANSTSRGLSGILSGWSELDDLTAGLQRGTLVAVAGRAGVGKSTFLTNLARQLADGGGRTTLLISMESDHVEIARQLLAAKGGVDGHRLRKGHLRIDDIQRLMDAGDILRSVPLSVSAPSRLSPPQLEAYLREQRTSKDDLVVLIDCLDAIDPDNPRDFRQEQVAATARRLKGLARELNVPIVVSVRLGRPPNSSSDGPPAPADLKHNSAVEHEADVLILLHRPDLCNYARNDDVLEVLVAKQRGGPTGQVTLAYIKQYCRLVDYAPDDGYAT